MKVHRDVEGNQWHKQQAKEDRVHQGVAGVHAILAFQCEDCWIMNLEGRESGPEEDRLYRMLIRRANLDAMCGRAEGTIRGHVRNVLRAVRNCSVIGKTPSINARGPLPLCDNAGMGTAVEMLYESITTAGVIDAAGFIQFDTMRKLRSTFTLGYATSPEGLTEFSSISKGFGKMSLTKCPTQSDFFSWFLSGAEYRMGYETNADRPLASHTISHLLGMIREEAESRCPGVARDMLFKVGAAIAVGVAGSLRGNEIFFLDLAGTRELLPRGKDGVVPPNPLKKGTNLKGAPYVHLALQGKFKGENNVRHHLIAVASFTMSGIQTRWWIEKLIAIREREGHTSGPAFADSTGRLANTREYNAVLRAFLTRIQADKHLGMLTEKDDIEKNYGFFRTWRKSAENAARAAGLEADVQKAMNRWSTIESAQGKRPKFNMIEHYSSSEMLMPVTWRYSYVQ